MTKEIKKIFQKIHALCKLVISKTSKTVKLSNLYHGKKILVFLFQDKSNLKI